MTTTKFSIANILNIEPAPICCMGLQRESKTLALFRGGCIGQIEIWNVEHQPFLENVIIELELVEGKPSVESVLWAEGRLFSCGLHGYVLEHNLTNGRIQSKSLATSGPVWCLAANNMETVIAAGTEDGFINLFQIENKSLNYWKVLDRQEGRVLSLCWSVCDKYIASGSADSVRFWDVDKGHAVQRLQTGRSKNKETIVWSVLVLEDLTIVSGDSRGIVSFWDGRIGVLKFKIQSHKSDVLCIKLSEDKNSIYAGGVDSQILILTKVGGSDKWVKSHSRNIHVNDVLCLETYGNRLFSGGIDADLGMSSFPPRIIMKYPPLPRHSSVHSSAGSKTLLLQETSGLTIWNLPVELNDYEPKKVLQLTSKRQESIYSSCLSPDGKTFGYSTLSSLQFFEFENKVADLKTPLMHKLRIGTIVGIDGKNLDPMVHLRFLNQGVVVLIPANGNCVAFLKIDCDKGELRQVECVKTEYPENKSFGLNIVEVSSDGQYLCLSHSSKIVIYNVSIDNYSVKRLGLIPERIPQPTVVKFHPTMQCILIVYADSFIQVWDYKNSQILFQECPRKKVDDLYPIINGSWSPNGQSAVLHQADTLYMLEMTSDVIPKKKMKKGNPSPSLEDCFKFSLHSSTFKCAYLAYIGYINEGKDIFGLEVNPKSLLEKLPPSFIKKRFGT